MAFRPLTEADCGQKNPLIHLASHVTRDHTFSESHGHLFPSSSEDQLVEQFLQETRALPQTFRMDGKNIQFRTIIWYYEGNCCRFDAWNARDWIAAIRIAARARIDGQRSSAAWWCVGTAVHWGWESLSREQCIINKLFRFYPSYINIVIIKVEQNAEAVWGESASQSTSQINEPPPDLVASTLSTSTFDRWLDNNLQENNLIQLSPKEFWSSYLQHQQQQQPGGSSSFNVSQLSAKQLTDSLDDPKFEYSKVRLFCFVN